MTLPRYFRNTTWQAFMIPYSALHNTSTYQCRRITVCDLQVTCDLLHSLGYAVIRLCVPFSELEIR